MAILIYKGDDILNEDTIKLLRSLSYGTRMCAESFDEVLSHIKNEEMKNVITQCNCEHEKVNAKIDGMLEAVKEEPKSPNMMAKGMTWMKINFEMWHESDNEKAAAGLITDGCNMGIKLLNHYLNDYENADENAKDLVKELIASETACIEKIKKFL